MMKAFVLSLGFFKLVVFSALLLAFSASGCTQPPAPALDQSSVPNPQAAPPPPPLGGTATASAPPLPVANYITESRIRQLNFNESGQVDGFLLYNGVLVHFPQGFSGTVPPLWTQVSVSGFLRPADASGRTVVEAQLIVERPRARQLGAVNSVAAALPPPSPPPVAPAGYAPPPPPPPPPPPGGPPPPPPAL